MTMAQADPSATAHAYGPRKRFTDHIVVVTGGSRGIGAEISRQFVGEGAQVVIGYGQDADRAHRLAETLSEVGKPPMSLQMDVRNADSVRGFFGTVAERFGRLDVLVNNAGRLISGTLEESRIEDWDETFAVNVRGVYLCCRFGAPLLMGGTADDGSSNGDRCAAIVNVASRLAYTGAPGSLAYGASKAAVINMTKAMARQMAPRVRVNAVAPAYTLTEMTATEPESMRRSFVAATPLGRLATPEDTAAAVLFLAGSEAGFITGHALLVDGGNTL